MGRRAKVGYWPSRGSWQDANGEWHTGAYCCWFQGKQVILAEGPDDYFPFPSGPTFKTALKKFAQMVTLGSAACDQKTVEMVCELYLQHIATRRKSRTYEIRKQHLQPFVSALGDTPIASLTAYEIEKWMDSMREWRVRADIQRPTRWTNGSVRCAATSIKAALNWAAKKGLIRANPITGLDVPEARSRGRETLIGRTPAERAQNHQRILDASTKAFRPFVVCLHATGCRPSELAHATATDFDGEAIVYHSDDNRLDHEFQHKTSGSGKDRRIILTGEALAIVQELAAKNRKGPLFRTSKGKGWTVREIVLRFGTIREKTGIPRLTAYSYRHTFATSWLEQGRSIEILAELLGNSPAVLRKHYSHLLSDTDNLRKQMEGFTGSLTLSAEDERTRTTTSESGASSV